MLNPTCKIPLSQWRFIGLLRLNLAQHHDCPIVLSSWWTNAFQPLSMKDNRSAHASYDHLEEIHPNVRRFGPDEQVMSLIMVHKKRVLCKTLNAILQLPQIDMHYTFHFFNFSITSTLGWQLWLPPPHLCHHHHEHFTSERANFHGMTTWFWLGSGFSFWL